MRLGKWKISYVNLWTKREPLWLYRWQFRFILFTALLTDLDGLVIFLNFGVKWEKMFKGKK